MSTHKIKKHCQSLFSIRKHLNVFGVNVIVPTDVFVMNLIMRLYFTPNRNRDCGKNRPVSQLIETEDLIKREAWRTFSLQMMIRMQWINSLSHSTEYGPWCLWLWAAASSVDSFFCLAMCLKPFLELCFSLALSWPPMYLVLKHKESNQFEYILFFFCRLSIMCVFGALSLF